MRTGESATWRYSARRNDSALAAGRNGSVALPTGSRAPSASRSTHGSTTESGRMLRRSTVMVAIAIRSGSPWVYGASTGVRTRSPITSSITVSSLRPKCGDSASTPMASAPWATVCAQPLSGTKPRTSFSRRYQVATRSPHSITLAAGTRSSLLFRSMHSASTSTENARRKTESVPVLAQSDGQAGGHAVAETGDEVVVHAPVDPGGERRPGQPVAHVGVGGAEHGGQLGRQVGEWTVAGHGQTGGLHLAPVGPSHGAHGAMPGGGWTEGV